MKIKSNGVSEMWQSNRLEIISGGEFKAHQLVSGVKEGTIIVKRRKWIWLNIPIEGIRIEFRD